MSAPVVARTNRKMRRAIASEHPFGWAPWERGYAKPLSEEQIAEIARRTNSTMAAVASMVADGLLTDTIWTNNVYQVAIRLAPPVYLYPKGVPIGGDQAMKHLSIKRRDRKPVGIERFQHFQRIKSDLLGDEVEAVELYPAESRLVDGAHQYHLWALFGARFPFGFNNGRLVTVPISEPDGGNPPT